MEKVLYAALVAGLAWVIGAAGFGALVLQRLAVLTDSKTNRRHYIRRALFKGAYAMTSAVLLFRVIVLGAADPTIWAWLYLGGLGLAGYAATGLAVEAAGELAEVEAWQEKHRPGESAPHVPEAEHQEETDEGEA